MVSINLLVGVKSGSYTTLTLPAERKVEILVGRVSLKKKINSSGEIRENNNDKIENVAYREKQCDVSEQEGTRVAG
ncbi:hypothetical protein, partial [Escherichia coli]|uniref:hypothetical protein n=1 Tax=Escherichia coli TaxID=562 RepID=UPI001BD3842C